MKRTPLLRKTRLQAKTPLHASKPLRRTAAPKKKPRSKAESLRVYGTPEFKAYLHAHPCLWCGRQGVEAAHLRGNGGLSKKRDWRTTGPLCGGMIRTVSMSRTADDSYTGCHARWDRRAPERFWFTDAQRTSILLRLDAFHEAWEATR